MSKANEPAFPWLGTMAHQESGPGLTKRELFAAMAMQGILGGNQRLGDLFPEQPWGDFSDVTARAAINYADALIAELEKLEVRS